MSASKKYQVEFDVANPSNYPRDDYVQVNLESLQVPKDLDETNLALFRVFENNRKQELPFQIDFLFGKQRGVRIMTFLSGQMRGGLENYSQASARFLLQESSPKHWYAPSNLWAKCHCDNNDEAFFAEKPIGSKITGIKLFNGSLDTYFKLRVVPKSQKGLTYTGAATSVELPEIKDFTGMAEILAPYWDEPEKLWGQIREVVFFPLPWEQKWFHRFSLLDQDYDLIWLKSGPIRAIATIKSKPMPILYDGNPFFSGSRKVHVCLYRVLYVYPEKPYYTEELYALTEENHQFISFRPYYFSKIPAPNVQVDLKRFDHIPDYFAVWKHFGPYHYYGYGFATDVHTRAVQVHEDTISWRLTLSRYSSCVHYFMFDPSPSQNFDPFKTIGHKGWYERVFKPLRPVAEALRFPPSLEYED